LTLARIQRGARLAERLHRWAVCAAATGIALCAALVPSHALAAVPVARDDGAPSLTALLAAAHADSGDGLGASVAVSGDTAVTGAPYGYLDTGTNPGYATVFVRSGGVWAHQSELTSPDGSSLDRFGSSVAIVGDTIIVGAPGDDEGKGSAYVFVRSGGVWSLQQKISVGDGLAGDGFGTAVALSGDIAIVGSPASDREGLAAAGVAHVFSRAGSTWSYAAQLGAADAQQDAYFGSSIALDVGTVAIGAPGQDSASAAAEWEAGAAYVYRGSGSVWTQEAKLAASLEQPFAYFGSSLAIDGDTIIVGAFGAESSRGAAYVFKRAGTWTEQSLLVPESAAPGAAFGWAVALAGDAAVIGAPYDDSGADTAEGAAYMYARSGSAWAEQSKLFAGNGRAYDGLGASVAAANGVALVGADSAGDIYGGLVYEFSGLMPAATLRDQTLLVAPPGVLGNDLDPGGMGLTAGVITQPANGTVTLLADGSFSYRPVAGRIGTDHFHYSASDAGHASSPATVTVRVAQPSSRPVARDDVATVSEDSSVTVRAPGVLANDQGNGRALTAEVLSDPEHGVLDALPDGSFNYVPDPRWHGTDHFHYAADDGRLVSWPATVTITVTHTNHAPSAADDRTLEQVPGPDGGEFARFGYKVTMSGDTMAVADDSSSVTHVMARVDGTWVRQLKVDGDAPALDGDTLAVGAYWPDSCTGVVRVYTRTGTQWTLQAELTSPYTGILQYFGRSVALEGDMLVVGAPGPFIDDRFPDRAYVFRRNGTSWALESELSRPTPAPLEAFGFSVALSRGTAVVGAPYAEDDRGAAYVFERGTTGWTLRQRLAWPERRPGQGSAFTVASAGDSVLIGMRGQLAQGYVQEFTRSSGTWSQKRTFPASGPRPWGEGTVAMSGDTAVVGWLETNTAEVYSRRSGAWETVCSVGNPAGIPQWFGRSAAVSWDSVAVSASMTSSPGFPATVYVLRAPYRTNEDTVLQTAAPGVLANDSDIDGDAIRAELLTGPLHGSVALSADGSFIYTPQKDWNGLDHFHYRSFDGSAYSASAAVWVGVRPVDDAPLGVPDTMLVSLGATTTVAAPGVLANDYDGDGDSLVATLASSPASGTLALAGDGSFEYRPNGTFAGTDSFQYRASDGHLFSSPTLVELRLRPIAAASSISIGTTARSTRVRGIPILSGTVTPLGLIGKNIVVYVKKPGKRYWTYSSNRTAYGRSGRVAWQYKYFFRPGMAKGVYYFKAAVPAWPGFVGSESSVISIRLK
jgi:hypothetical protein